LAVILNGYRKDWALFRIWIDVTIHFLKRYRNPFLLGKIHRSILDFRNSTTPSDKITKIAKVGGKYFLNSNMSGWPDQAFFRPLEIEVSKGFQEPMNNLQRLKIVQVALTKKCPLNCEHCYEGHELNKKDTITLEDHKKIVKKLQNAGVALIQYAGGEPMTKVDQLVQIFKSADPSSKFQIFTSGFNCTLENLSLLKEAGLSGISVSIDHYEKDKHNAFRRNDKSFDWAIEAARNAVQLNLVLTFTLCVTKEFCTNEQLWSYLHFAKNQGASFVQLSEPRAAGNYENQNVSLTPDQTSLLDSFFIEANTESQHASLPIVLNSGFHQRRRGCFGAGEHFLYIDTDGYINSCPFCRNKKNHILSDSCESDLNLMRNEGCGIKSI
jgi:MoaA/NifB/PqqE/SkfB family radical SAM enzyme